MTAGDDTALTGLQELAVAIAVAAALAVGALFAYHSLTGGANDDQVQQSISAAATAAQAVYQDTQDYGLIGSDDPSATPGCSTSTPAFQDMAQYAPSLTLTCAALTSYALNTVVVSSGELTDGDGGGWIGLASRSDDGICWMLYQPADGAADYGQFTPAGSQGCSAPTSAPSPGATSW